MSRLRAVPFGVVLPARLDRLVARVAPSWAGERPPAAGGAGARLLRPLLPLVVLAVVVQSVAHAVNVAVFDLSVTRFSADADTSLVGWLGTLTTGLVGWGALQLALVRPRLRGALVALALLCLFLSFDDMTAVHEDVAELALRWDFYAHAGYNLWPAVYLPLLTVTGWLLARTARGFDASARNAVLVGLVCLVAAVVLEFSAPLLYAAGSDRGQPLYESEVLVEEALETLGWAFIALGIWAGALDHLLSGDRSDVPRRSGLQEAER